MSAPTRTRHELPDRLAETVERASAYLLSRQDAEGWWKGELQTNVTMEAEDLLLRRFLGIAETEQDQQTARWIRSRQLADGTWNTFVDGPPELSTTVEAYVALKLAGDHPDDPHMAQARSWILAHGGLEATRVFTRIWLALFGQWSWDELPVMPPELVLLPRWAPLTLSDWACWARQTVVPLTVVSAHRPVRELGVDIGELRTGVRPATPRLASVAGLFHRLDRVLHRYERRPLRVLRRLAERRAAEWVLARQEADGSWGGIQPPWVYSLLALHLLGYALDHPAMRAGLSGLDRFTVLTDSADGPVRRLEACQSPVWDTGLAVIALRDAGLPGDEPALQRAGAWLLAEEIDADGDWQAHRPHLPHGGWAFEFDNDGYPDTDDTAEILMALHRLELPTQPAIDRGIRWLLGMQCADGGWGSFDADGTATLPRKLPFCDFGEVVDPPSADVTAHIVEALARLGRPDHPATRRGVDWLLAEQEDDGSWFGRWGANYLYGTGAVVPALVAAGVSPDSVPVRRAVQWLTDHQNADGGWGEDLRSYTDRSWAGRGDSTPSQTAWALLALHAASERGPVARRGLQHLIDTQRPDGGWDERHYTGTGFPGDFYISYEMYRLVFPLSALGRYHHTPGGEHG